ncbi:branched-chain amino acid ABC transporter substrate-binding protein [Bacillaceae bacterium SIJ1]|uniref:branched-chain amino acid ABC transporter substrate-binding protein n=1 Tax=Litoribacterium kuwaitense TaxID=1398745 RepID=UPI0013EBD111|nr:branched-chain amino acid ABC transporter substrate-binding protein [Litoribacterium kuwaitense]NGP44644.1 branched-chain amino acid ABC transporter substrate-binding protein [Litoribacterium kuwaitense]
MYQMKDERLKWQQLKNTRTAFTFQSIAILGLVIYRGAVDGAQAAFADPLWLVFVGTIVLLTYLNMRISVQVEQTETGKPPGPYWVKVVVALGVGLIGALIYLVATPDWTLFLVFLIGAVIFICFLVPFSLIHYWRLKEIHDEDE